MKHKIIYILKYVICLVVLFGIFITPFPSILGISGLIWRLICAVALIILMLLLHTHDKIAKHL